MTLAVRRGILGAVVAALGAATVIACVRVAREAPSMVGAPAGIVGSFAVWLGVSPRAVALASWLGAWVLALIAALAFRADTSGVRTNEHRAAPAADRLAWLWRAGPWLVTVSVLVLLGVALRAHAAAWSPWDIDEPWAFPSPLSLFDDSHDALVHPPLYRALALGWDALIGWTTRAPPWLLRVPSLVSGGLSLALVAYLAVPRPSPRALLALLLALLASAAIAVSALARPYAFATLAVVLLVAVVADAAHRRLTPLEAALCVLAVALAAWTDLVAALVVLLTLAVRCSVDACAARWRDATVLALCASVPLVPLTPGALHAWRTGIDPTTSAIAGPLPDLQPSADALTATRELLTATTAPLPTLVVFALLIVLIALAWQRRARASAVLLALTCAVPLVLAPHLALRARHLAWLPLIACAVLAILPPPLPKRAR